MSNLILTDGSNTDMGASQRVTQEGAQAPKLQLIDGGKVTTDNWLKELEEGTVFLCIPADQVTLDAAEWHVQLHANDYTKLHSNLNNPMTMWVSNLRFSRQMKLAMVLGSNAAK